MTDAGAKEDHGEQFAGCDQTGRRSVRAVGLVRDRRPLGRRARPPRDRRASSFPGFHVRAGRSPRHVDDIGWAGTRGCRRAIGPLPTPDRPSTASAPALPTGAHVVVSPSPGILWRSPEPGAPPFADIGDVVDASATVGIVEVMKLMTHVKAGVGGEIVAVCVENGVAVQKGEPLFAIAPTGSSS